jgi:hypothetical protein
MKKRIVWLAAAISLSAAAAVWLYPNEIWYLFWDLRYGSKVEWNGLVLQLPRGEFTWSTTDSGKLYIQDRRHAQTWLTLNVADNAEQLPLLVLKDQCASAPCRAISENHEAVDKNTLSSLKYVQTLDGVMDRSHAFFWIKEKPWLMEFSGPESLFPRYHSLAANLAHQLLSPPSGNSQ